MKKLFPQIFFTQSLLGTVLSLYGQAAPVVSVSPTTTSEAAGSAQIQLVLSTPATGGESLTVELVPVTASSQDFEPLSSSTIEFAAGASSALVTVELVDDVLPEIDESFQLVMSGPTGVTLGTPTTTHTITSEDVEIALPAFFSDGMVLQRDKGAKVWGFALPSSAVTVSFAGQSQSATTDGSGRFEVTFNNLAATSTGSPLVISSPGTTTRTIADVVVGEVWMGAGQSNMDFPLNFLPTAENNNEIASANDPLLRIFVPTEQARPEPQVLVGGSWFAATPGSTADFSALAYYFGKRLRAELGVPVAILECAWGGQPIDGFISEEKLGTFEEGLSVLAARDYFYGVYADELAAFEAEHAAWVANPVGPEPVFDADDPRFGAYIGGQLFNGMVAPMVGYGMRGILWYQGEGNSFAFNTSDYAPLLTALAEDWRERWGEQLPFYYVQLPNYVDGNLPLWVDVQDAQRRSLDLLPRSGMAVTNDIGDVSDIHPANKSDFADRLVRWPLHNEYGQAAIVPSGPLYRGATRQGSSVIVEFDYSVGLTTRDGLAPGGFQLKRADGSWENAAASLSGEKVVVSAASVSAPVAVRYAWEQDPTAANLVNGAGLPASVFEAVPTVGVLELYRDTFNDLVLGLNPDAANGLVNIGTTGDAWSEASGQMTYSGEGANNRASVYTLNDFDVTSGFTLEVTYSIESLAAGNNNQFSFGLVRDYVPGVNNPFLNSSLNADGIGFSIAAGTSGGPNQGLMRSVAGSSASTLTLESPFQSGTGGAHTLTLTLIPDGNGGADWSYSYDGAAAVTGNFAVFDFVGGGYSFMAHGRDGLIEKSIQEVSLSTFGAGLPVLTATVSPTNEGLIGLPITFTLSEAATSEVSFQFDTVAGDAFPIQDYLPWSNGLVEFAAGETEQFIVLTMIDDAVIEPDENFSLALSNPIGLLLASDTVPLVIVNDDSVLDDFGDSYGLPTAERMIASDGDGDGVGLFLEYAFNLDPTVAATPDYVPGQLLPFNNEPYGLPVLRTETDPVTGVTTIKYQYIRRTDSAPKVTYITEVSSDSLNFTPAEPDEVRQIATFWEEVTVIIGCTQSDTSRCFARVRIEVEDDDGDGA
ncbi:Calx-beta domain-containing protein [Roseibacillus persicicus]|uniref:Calx-beta domain-containing protein n=1 Tax=Roseibacillus persicicus TaxID=454148 RepID=A0A918WGF0_9BACT|nr:Calx-beta domain-containing protein [Roseibacillus persicicus]GHC45268.1 hypothetical protein GCM10007100_08170 [Roseibacillus persicicus]